MHRHLQVGVPQRFHDGEGICSRHAHLRSEGVADSKVVNPLDAYSKEFRIFRSGSW